MNEGDPWWKVRGACMGGTGQCDDPHLGLNIGIEGHRHHTCALVLPLLPLLLLLLAQDLQVSEYCHTVIPCCAKSRSLDMLCKGSNMSIVSQSSHLLVDCSSHT